MSKYFSLGTMSGTSMDGIDLSIISSDGEAETKVIDNLFFEYRLDFKKELIQIRKEIIKKDDLIDKRALIDDLSRKITLLHAEAIQIILKKEKNEIKSKVNRILYSLNHDFFPNSQYCARTIKARLLDLFINFH